MYLSKFIELYNKLSEISDEEERNFKKYWVIQMALDELWVNSCRKCVMNGDCWTHEALVNLEVISNTCNVDSVVELVKLYRQTDVFPWNLGNEKHNKWIEDLRRLVG